MSHFSLVFIYINIIIVLLNVIRRISLLRYLYINVSYLTIYWSCHVRTSTGNEKLSCSHVTDISSVIQFVLAYVIIPHKGAQGLTLDSPPPHCPRLAYQNKSSILPCNAIPPRLSQQVCVSQPVIVFIERLKFIREYGCEECCPGAIYTG